MIRYDVDALDDDPIVVAGYINHPSPLSNVLPIDYLDLHSMRVRRPRLDILLIQCRR